jgi:homoserine kinase type II
MSSVYVVQHTRKMKDNNEDVKLIGIYTSRQLAESAISGLKTKKGFSDDPNDFAIDEYQLDQTHWQDGFGIDV